MKKILLSIAGLAGLLAASTPVSAGHYPLGDLNCSGKVTSRDISIMMQVVAGAPRPGHCTTPIDLNCSGAPSSADIAIIVHLAAGGTYVRAC